MTLVTISTLYQTCYVAILLLMSKGWLVVRTELSRSDLSSITLLIGGVYLTYSAYYVAMNIASVRLFMGFILNIMYLLLFWVVFRNSYSTRVSLLRE